MNIVLIRHGLTKGNLERRYVGSTDEGLCKEGIDQLKKLTLNMFYPKLDKIYVSPMLRCVETVRLLYPDMDYIIDENFRECHFGIFEYKNYEQLKDNTEYRQWIDSKGQKKIPEGEEQDVFKLRCQKAFYHSIEKITVTEWEQKNVGFILHGGSIMAILERYASQTSNFYDWQCKNAEGYVCQWDSSRMVLVPKRKLFLPYKV